MKKLLISLGIASLILCGCNNDKKEKKQETKVKEVKKEEKKDNKDKETSKNTSIDLLSNSFELTQDIGIENNPNLFVKNPDKDLKMSLKNSSGNLINDNDFEIIANNKLLKPGNYTLIFELNGNTKTATLKINKLKPMNNGRPDEDRYSQETKKSNTYPDNVTYSYMKEDGQLKEIRMEITGDEQTVKQILNTQDLNNAQQVQQAAAALAKKDQITGNVEYNSANSDTSSAYKYLEFVIK